MEVCRVTLFYTAIVAFFGRRIFSEECNSDLIAKSDDVRLRNDLFCSYNKNVRPVINQLKQTTVNTSVVFYTIHLHWKDEFLTWDPAKYNNIYVVYEDSNKIWTPDIISLVSGFDGENKEFSLNLPSSIMTITNNGDVGYNHHMTMNSQCSANLKKWPFDSHECEFFLGSPIYSNTLVNFTFQNNSSHIMDFYIDNKEWHVKNIRQQCLDFMSMHHCFIQYVIEIERYSSMYISSILIPAVVISLMRTFTFLMSGEKFRRIILLSLFFIAEVLYIKFLDTKIPNNGDNIVYIVVLFRNSLILTATAIVISVITSKLYAYGTEDFPSDAPKWLKSSSAFFLNIKLFSTLTNFNTHGAELLIEKNTEEDSLNSQRNQNSAFWKTLSILLDRLFLIISLSISLINLLFLMP